ncbi:MAG: hypothetical protein JWN09_2937 [Microbacteriaceae bacterium]|nr:hypothetical protein [Microbacteriaceae bacterium]
MIVGLTAVNRAGTDTSLVRLDGARFCFCCFGIGCKRAEAGCECQEFDELADGAGLEVFVEGDEDVLEEGEVH